RGKVILRSAWGGEIRCKPDHGFAIRPGRCAESVAGRDIKRSSVARDASRPPDAAASCARCPGHDVLRVFQRNAHHPALILTAIAKMTAERHVDSAVENSERAALILIASDEILSLRAKRGGHINGPARHHRAILQG